MNFHFFKCWKALSFEQGYAISSLFYHNFILINDMSNFIHWSAYYNNLLIHSMVSKVILSLLQFNWIRELYVSKPNSNNSYFFFHIPKRQIFFQVTAFKNLMNALKISSNPLIKYKCLSFNFVVRYILNFSQKLLFLSPLIKHLKIASTNVQLSSLKFDVRKIYPTTLFIWCITTSNYICNIQQKGLKEYPIKYSNYLYDCFLFNENKSIIIV
ncbi:hypothetical protein RFI_32938, partial [Reticulomyxa filosa]